MPDEFEPPYDTDPTVGGYVSGGYLEWSEIPITVPIMGAERTVRVRVPAPPDTLPGCRCALCDPAGYAQTREQALITRQEENAAREKAEALLRSLLDDDQWHMLREYGYIVITSQSGRTYRIGKRYAGNIDRLSKAGKVVETLCCYPRSADRPRWDRIPIADSMAAQVLALRFNEKEFRQIAEIN